MYVFQGDNQNIKSNNMFEFISANNGWLLDVKFTALRENTLIYDRILPRVASKEQSQECES